MGSDEVTRKINDESLIPPSHHTATAMDEANAACASSLPTALGL